MLLSSLKLHFARRISANSNLECERLYGNMQIVENFQKDRHVQAA